MESQPQNPEFRIYPENFHPWVYIIIIQITICLTYWARQTMQTMIRKSDHGQLNCLLICQICKSMRLSEQKFHLSQMHFLSNLNSCSAEGIRGEINEGQKYPCSFIHLNMLALISS